jgi:hypothetical protein
VKVLVGCENSGIIRDAFIRRGHDAVSCDLLPPDRPGPHYQGDVRDLLVPGAWGLFICHPDCTFICSSGLHWNKKRPEREQQTLAALDFVRGMMAAPVPRIAIENPVGRIGTAIVKATQYVQPYEYGHDASKRTGLWLQGLPKLVADPSKYVVPRLVEWPVGSGKTVKRWANQTDSGQNALPPSADRWKLRAETYQGWAEAMADQWGDL